MLPSSSELYLSLLLGLHQPDEQPSEHAANSAHPHYQYVHFCLPAALCRGVFLVDDLFIGKPGYLPFGKAQELAEYIAIVLSDERGRTAHPRGRLR